MESLGIMQGRFTNKGGFFPQQFPWSDWEKEFEISERVGLQCIEWMFNFENFSLNPLLTSSGQKEIANIMNSTGIRVQSVCANYFMKKGIFRDPESLEMAQELIFAMSQNQIHLLILPLFEDNDPQNEDQYVLLKQAIQKVLSYTKQHDVQLGIETDWELGKIQDFLQISESLGVCYDLGNAAGLGKNPVEEIRSLGSRVIDVHIKDKPVGGGTVMLGEGSVDYYKCFKMLETVSYNGPYILESYYRENAIKDTMQNIDYIREQFMR